MELIRRIGKEPASFTYSDCRLERRGFLSIFSFAVSGKRGRLDLMDRGHAVVVLPADFRKRELYMIEQPRHVKAFASSAPGIEALERAKAGGASDGAFTLDAKDVSVFELPAGMIDPGETPAQAASRELREETGIVVAPEALREVAAYHPSIGGSTELMTAFIAELPDPAVTGDAGGDGGEQIAVWRMTFEEAWWLMASRRIETASSLLLLRELKIIDFGKKRP
ncbi:MAG: hypothetical protein RL272_350 [Candidatus Parcubacteria bacterium]|jgi:hypothetical protein